MSRRADYIFSTTIILFSTVLLILTFQIPETSSTYIIGPRFWPAFLLIFMLILGVLLLFKTFIKDNADKKKNDSEVELAEEVPVDGEVESRGPFIFIMITVVIGYILLINVLGFLVSTIVFMYLGNILLGTKNQLTAILTSVIGTLVLLFVFSNLLSIPLPRGMGIFDNLSYFIY